MVSQSAIHLLPDHRPGEVLAGRYRLERKLGEGGMGVVWLARSTALDVDVALKILRRELAGTEAVERMAREARTAAQLGHPAILRVFDFGTSEQGDPFLVMELLEGEDLNTRREREQRIDANTAIGLMLPIIDALGTAHEQGIVHRDIKPENIFITSDTHGRVQPKLLDFGIAKLGREQASLRLTQVGAVMGSPYYLSPEQAEGLEDIDFRCDIWSVGVVLYELVTGVRPFEAANYNALIRGILSDTPQPTTAHLAGDAQLWLIIGQCLKKDREQRWGSMWELGEALALWLFERGVRVDAASRSLRHGWLDGHITGVRILVKSNHPEPEVEREVLTLPAPPVSGAALLARPNLTGRELEQVEPKPRKAGMALGLGIGLAVVVAGLSALAFVRSTSDEKPETVKAEVRPTTAVTPKVVVPPAPPPATSTEPLVPPGVEAASAAPVASDRPAVKVAPTPSARPAAASAPGRAAPPPRRKPSREFGF